MLAIQITSMKIFMNRLLNSDTFDSFLLEEAVISTANTYTIDGHINKDFYPAEERTTEYLPYDLQPWSEIKGLCFNLIKGKHTPLYFKFVLQLKPDSVTSLLEKEQCTIDSSHVKAFVLNIRYDGTTATLTTGTSYHTFVMSKEPDSIWDKALLRFLSMQEIPYENLT